MNECMGKIGWAKPQSEGATFSTRNNWIGNRPTLLVGQKQFHKAIEYPLTRYYLCKYIYAYFILRDAAAKTVTAWALFSGV